MSAARTNQVCEVTATGTATTDHREEPHLARSLTNRHIQMIAIGGAIGTGLFMGSGKTTCLAGPAVLFVCMIIGLILFFVMRAMGEILLSNLDYKSFGDLAGDILGPWAGFVTSWSYWFYWVVAGVADVVAITASVQVLASGTPLFLPALLVPVLLLTLNLPSVKVFGELEFWFAIVKVVAILALIVTGAIMIGTQFTSPDGAVARLSNIWNDGGMFPHGAMGFVLGFQIAILAFGGIDLVGTAAAETKDPKKTMPLAINLIPIRVYRVLPPPPAVGRRIGFQDARLDVHALRGADVLRTDDRGMGPGRRHRMGLIVVPLWFMALALAWYVNRQTLLQKARIEEWKAEAAGDRVALAWRVGADHSVST